MIIPSIRQAYSSYAPVSTRTGSLRKQANEPAWDKPPRKPDWLLVMVIILFLLTLLIAGLVDVPVLSR